MKIAIVAPSPVPFSLGGAEKLWCGLQNAINKHTHHQCEVIKCLTKEHNFWDLIESYYKCYQLDLSHFDMVISGKYPAWMVRHQNHHIYTVHCLRGLYDTYPFMNSPFDFHSDHPKVNKLLSLTGNNNIQVHDYFELLFALKDDNSIPENTFNFPGPFIRKIIHFLDKKAMLYINNFSAISRTVANRKEYYPEGTEVKVIYPPSSLDFFKAGSYNYFFTVSRLDRPKRIEMIIEAYSRTQTKIPLKIAGTGPQQNALKALAKNDKRIEFLGFLSDNELIDYYADAYAVIFVPYDEDYGLITVEAMMSEKPVITFRDSGGVTEFVENDKTGYICEPDVDKLQEIIEKASNTGKETMIQMGKRAKQKVGTITWEYTIGELLKQNLNSFSIKKQQRKLTAVSTFPIYPPRSGGQNGIFYRYRELAKSIKVEIVSLTNENEKPLRREIAPNLWEIRIPKSKSHAQKELQIERKVGIPITDIAMLYLYEETPELVESLRLSSEDSDYVVCCHPYSYLLVKQYTDKKVIHESHNVEYLLKKQMLPENKHAKRLLEKVFEAEKRACLETELTTVVTIDDAKAMNKIYGLDMNKAVEVPSGVDLESVHFTSLEKRMEIKKELNLENIILAVFIGGWHQPNIEAVERIFEMAKKSPQVKFLIIGSVGLYFKDKARPANVGLMGIVDDEEKDYVFSIADVALNPMLSGSGVNLKLLDYMAAGIPVITTKFGARGLYIPDGLTTVCEIEEFDKYMLMKFDQDKIQMARQFVEEKFDWSVIVKQLENYYLKKDSEKIDNERNHDVPC